MAISLFSWPIWDMALSLLQSWIFNKNRDFVIFVGRKMLSISDLMHTVYIIMNELCGHFSTVFGAWLACIPLL